MSENSMIAFTYPETLHNSKTICTLQRCILVVISSIINVSMWFVSGLHHRHWGNRMIAPVLMKWPWKIWVRSANIWPQQGTESASRMWNSVSSFTRLPRKIIIFASERSSWWWYRIKSTNCIDSDKGKCIIIMIVSIGYGSMGSC